MRWRCIGRRFCPIYGVAPLFVRTVRTWYVGGIWRYCSTTVPVPYRTVLGRGVHNKEKRPREFIQGACVLKSSTVQAYVTYHTHGFVLYVVRGTS